MPDMNENSETQQEYFGKITKEELKNRVLNGGRGSGQSLRLLCEVYENRIAELVQENANLKEGNEYKNGVCKELAHQANVTQDRLTKAIELLKWALHSDPEHDDLTDFDTKWKEAEQFLQEIEK